MMTFQEERLARRKGPKTYSHLAKLARIPSEYEVSTTQLSYNAEMGFEVDTSVTEWYRKYRHGSPLTCSDWDKFYDPRQTFYRRYCEIENRRETYVDQVLERIDSDGYDDGLSDGWLDVLRVAFTPFRFPGHALQMIAAYVAEITPSSRVTSCAMFQGADEMRRVQRIAYRTKQLDLSRGSFGVDDRGTWEDDPVWQPLRECLEKLLVVRDWAEAFVALNLVVKPQIDLLLDAFGELAAFNDDSRLADILYSFGEDAAWQRDWSRVFVRTVIEDTPANQGVIEGWAGQWQGLASAAVMAFGPVFEQLAPKPLPFRDSLANLESRYLAWYGELGLERSGG